MSTSNGAVCLDYYRMYGADRAWKTKEVSRLIRVKQAEARSKMPMLRGEVNETQKKAMELFNMASEALKNFTNDNARKKYDKLLDEAYARGEINVEEQVRAENLIQEIERLFGSGLYEKAVEACTDAINRKLYDEKIYSLMAKSYQMMENVSQAIESVEAGLNIYPESLGVLATGARLYNIENQYDKAQTMINTMKNVEPDNKWAVVEQVYLYLNHDKEDLAYKDLYAYMNAHPNDREFMQTCAHDLVSYTYKFYEQDKQTGAYLLISEENYKKCMEIAQKAVGIYKDNLTMECLDNIKSFGETEFNLDNLESIIWSGIAAFIYLLSGVVIFTTYPNSGGVLSSLVMFLVGVPLAYATIQLYSVSKRPYWQIAKYYMTGQREKKEKRYILIGKILSFWMIWSIKLAYYIVRFTIRLVIR